MEYKFKLRGQHKFKLRGLVRGTLVRDGQGDVYVYTGNKDLDISMTVYADVNGMPVVNDVKNLERLLGNHCFDLIYVSEDIDEIKERNKKLEAQVEILQDTIKKLKN